MRGLWLSGLLALLLTSAATTDAQIPLTYRLSNLQNAPGVKWHRLETPHFDVIFPDSLRAEAQRVGSLLEKNFQPLVNSLGVRPRRIPVVLNNQAMLSNGYVAWGPRRSQWYAMPSTATDDFGPVDWYNMLAVHEGRHIVQEGLVRSAFGPIPKIFGDYTFAMLAVDLYFPSWFWEGDAVGLETALTSAGRGRQPSFLARSRSVLAADERYPYYRAWQGSDRTLLPNHYELGYVLTSYVRRHHGDSAWRRIVKQTPRTLFIPWALSNAMKTETGFSLPEIHRRAVAEADSTWRAQRERVTTTAARRLSPAATHYRNWIQPQYAGDGSVIAAYTDLNTPTQLVRLRDGRREVLLRRLQLWGDGQFHVQGDRVVWAESESDPRYAERSFTVIRRLDLSSGRVQRLTDRTRYLNPALSPDGNQIVATEFSLSRMSRVVVLDAGTGAVARQWAVDSGFLVTPMWTPDGKGIDLVRVDRERGNALLRFDLNGTLRRTLIDYRFAPITRPRHGGDKIFFGSPAGALDNVWVVDTTSGVLSKVTARPFGARTPTPSADGTRLLFSDQIPEGYDIAEMAVDASALQPAQPDDVDLVPLADSVVAQEQRLVLAQQAREVPQEWPVRKFSGMRQLFDFHSFALAPQSDAVRVRAELQSRNLLNTVGASVGVTFNRNERTLGWLAGASYAGLPVIVDVEGTSDRRAGSYVDSLAHVQDYGWDETAATVALRLPLTRLVGQRFQSLELSTQASRTHVDDRPVVPRFENGNGSFTPLTWRLNAYDLRPGAYRDRYPVGLLGAVTYRHTPGGGDYRSHLFAVQGTASVPGLFESHSALFSVGHEEQRPDNYRFASELLYPRGFGRRYADRMTRVSATYEMPLAWPDRGLGPVVYFRRLRGAAFVDGARIARTRDTTFTTFGSAGVDLTADLKWFGGQRGTSIGFRMGRRLTGDRGRFSEVLLSLF